MIIDLNHLDHATDGDAALQLELMVLFQGQLRVMIETLSGTFSPPVDMPAALHRLRGAAEAVGAGLLAQAIAQAELSTGQDASRGLDPGSAAQVRACLETTLIAVDEVIAAQRRRGLAKAGESG